MKKLAFLAILAATTAFASNTKWPAPKAPAVPQADGYIDISNAAVPPMKSRTYKSVFDATLGAENPRELLPALNMLASELNAFEVAQVPQEQVKFAIVFHGSAINGILKDSVYKKKFGVENPNLKVLELLNKKGVEIFVCGQNLASAEIDPDNISPDVKVASDALIVLIAYQNDGYASLKF